MKNIAAGLFLLAFLTGCSTTITNLTPQNLPRNQNNVYPFEVEFETSQKSIRKNTIKPYVMIGSDLYPMKPTPMLKHRWEAYVPVPAKINHVYYRYKFEYDFDRIPAPGQSSRLSPEYQLEIVDK